MSSIYARRMIPACASTCSIQPVTRPRSKLVTAGRHYNAHALSVSRPYGSIGLNCSAG